MRPCLGRSLEGGRARSARFFFFFSPFFFFIGTLPPVVNIHEHGSLTLTLLNAGRIVFDTRPLTLTSGRVFNYSRRYSM